ncbi:MAG: DUF523 domain-containing protein [Anaerolineales bacterium]|nr:DUF523 domain-containing protein [Anaerolineales bacterium]
MPTILISACLLGERVRYDGEYILKDQPQLTQWQNEGRVISICPEVAGGLPIPRPPAEITTGEGATVLDGQAKVMDIHGEDKTEAFISGAQAALNAAIEGNAQVVILKENSPSCGSTNTYDGTFSGTLVRGRGVTAALLEREGIRVFNEHQIQEAAEYLNSMDGT